MNSESPAMLFFNDSFNNGWKAYVDGVEQPVFHANYAFMAIPVTAGASNVVFRFEPKSFLYGAYCAAGGALLFLFAALGLYIFKASLDKSAPERPGEKTSLTERMWSNYKTFKLIYITFGLLSLVAVLQGAFNGRGPGMACYKSVEGCWIITLTKRRI